MSRGDADRAVIRARAVVGLYGDPTISWSIGVDVSFTRAYDGAPLADRCAGAAASHEHLGRASIPTEFPADRADSTLRLLLDAPYGDHDPLLRVAHSTDCRRLIVAAHHGAVDGLGLLALLALLIDREVASTARGIADRPPGAGFVRSSVARLGEAILRPPTRLGLTRDNQLGRSLGAEHVTGDVTARRDLPSTAADTARSVTATAQAMSEWNRGRRERSDRVVAAVGASRRDGKDAAPNRDTAYLRLRLPASPRVEDVRRALEMAVPEPTFPERRPSRSRLVLTRALRGRLGSSFLVSNLGLVQVPPELERIAFYPSAAGSRSLAVGVASTPAYTTLTVRMPGAAFSQRDADEACELIRTALHGLSPLEPAQ